MFIYLFIYLFSDAPSAKGVINAKPVTSPVEQTEKQKYHAQVNKMLLFTIGLSKLHKTTGLALHVLKHRSSLINVGMCGATFTP